MSKPHKFKPGKVVRTLGHVRAADLSGQWLYMHQKPLHPSFLSSMPFRTVARFVESGAIRIAKPNV